MIYYYLIKVSFYKGSEKILKEYRKNFLEIGELFTYLETKHKNNYTLISIRPLYSANGYLNLWWNYYIFILLLNNLFV